MRTTSREFFLHPSTKEDWPQIDFELQKNAQNDWLQVGEILRGVRSVNEYEIVDVIVEHPDANNWDFYAVPGTLGLMAQKGC